MAPKETTINSNKALWEKGDFTEIAALMRQSGEVVVESLGITPPLRALDLGSGDGTTAVPLARLGAEAHIRNGPLRGQVNSSMGKKKGARGALSWMPVRGPFRVIRRRSRFILRVEQTAEY